MRLMPGSGKRMAKTRRSKISPDAATEQCEGQCACGDVRIAIDVPAFWAWHDHSRATQVAQGCAYATYIGCWRSRLRILDGAESLTRFENPSTGSARCFCSRCGTPVFYERRHGARMVNIPRALFVMRTGREPRYHIGLTESPEWAYRGEAVAHLKGYPGVMRVRSKRQKPRNLTDDFAS